MYAMKQMKNGWYMIPVIKKNGKIKYRRPDGPSWKFVTIGSIILFVMNLLLVIVIAR